ncbi:MAG: hypothetical protein JSU70_21010 [Phycisphaerales bacterium]|nr:MAG: hypothetical protein JSU70_21010 [Phycisphaerales bacterium]
MALEYLSDGCQLDPNNVQILVDLSKVYYAQKDHRKSLEVAQRGVSSWTSPRSRKLLKI